MRLEVDGEMATEVVLEIFSGLENPVWKLDARQEAEFFSRLESLELQPEDEAERKLPPLGYSGFEIQSSRNGTLTEPIRVYRGTVDYTGRKFLDAGRRLEAWLLKTAPSIVSEKLIRKISDEIEQA